MPWGQRARCSRSGKKQKRKKVPKKKKKVASSGEVVGEALRDGDDVSAMARIQDAGGWGVESWGADEC